MSGHFKPPVSSPCITLLHGYVTYPAKGNIPPLTALADVSLTVYAGQHIAIIGENGSGKSTLLRLLAGHAWLRPTPDSGSIIWHTAEGDERSPIAGRGMCALVSTAQQEYFIQRAWRLTGQELLCTAFFGSDMLYTQPTTEQKQRAHEMAHDLGVAAYYANTIPELSQGQLRLLLLGRALLRNPQVLLLDEYTDGLDTEVRGHILLVLQKIAATTTLVLTTHRLESIPPCIRNYYCMAEGTLSPCSPPFAAEQKLSQTVPPKQEASHVTTSPYKTPANVSVKKTAPAIAQPTGNAPVAAAPRCSLTKTNAHACSSPHTARELPPLVHITDADIFIDRKLVLHALNWQWHYGEHWHIHGANGAGKSTFLRLLAGDEYPAYGGNIVRYLPQHGEFTNELSQLRTGIHLVSDALQALCPQDFSCMQLVLCGIDNTTEPQRAFTVTEEEHATKLLDRLGVAHLAARQAGSLSTGQLRRVLLCRALMNNPDMLLLDEPYSGLDATTSQHVCDLLCEVAAQGTHICLVTHFDADVLPFINRHATLRQKTLFVA